MPQLLCCQIILQAVLGLVIVEVKAFWTPRAQCGLHVLQELLMMRGILVCDDVLPLNMQKGCHQLMNTACGMID